MVLIFSHSNNSEQILRELQLAANARLHIIPFRIDDVDPNEDLQYYLSSPHWFDATTAPLEKHFDRLAIALKSLLGPSEKDTGKSVREILPPLAESTTEGSDKTIEQRQSPTIGAPPSQADLSPGSIADSLEVACGSREEIGGLESERTGLFRRARLCNPDARNQFTRPTRF